MAFVARHPRYCLLHLVLFSHRFIVKYVVMSKSYLAPNQKNSTFSINGETITSSFQKPNIQANLKFGKIPNARNRTESEFADTCTICILLIFLIFIPLQSASHIDS